MQVTQSILVAIFCMAVVFAVLGVLWAIIRIFSMIITMIETKLGHETKN
jgi:Na+-transporting methylmalonyl-CoA/oxaloacetate decarboxylase gamma subunit